MNNFVVNCCYFAFYQCLYYEIWQSKQSKSSSQLPWLFES